MPLFLSDEEFARCSGDGAAVAAKADAFIRGLLHELDTVRAKADAADINAEQNCSLIEQKYLSLTAEFSKLESNVAELQSSLDQRLREIAEVQSQNHRIQLQLVEKDREIERLRTEVAELHKSKRQLLELNEQKDLELSEKNATMKSYLDKIVRLSENAAHKEARLSEVEAEMARCRAACTRFEQEKEIVERQNSWLNEELNAKVNIVFELRRKHTEYEADMTSKLADMQRQFGESSKSLQWNKDRVRELEMKLKSVQEELISAKDVAAANEEQLSAELSTLEVAEQGSEELTPAACLLTFEIEWEREPLVKRSAHWYSEGMCSAFKLLNYSFSRSQRDEVNKLNELYKESSEEWSKKAADLEGVIKAMESHQKQVEDDYKEKLEKELSARKQVEKEATDLKERLEKCEAEIETRKKTDGVNNLPLSSFATESNFLWGGDQEHKKIPWVKWDVICLPKDDGGLGIKDLSKFNAALLGRWIWALSSNQNQLWARILISNYGGWSDLSNDGLEGWVGDKIKFWKDKWLGDDCNLEQQYNQLFMISGQQNNNISTMGSFSQGNWRWDLKWRRNLFDHEQDVAVAFMEAINAIQIQSHLQDTMVWKADPCGVYSTKSAYRILMTCNRHVSEANIFKTIWKLKIPPRAAVFSWRLIKDRLPTRHNLLRRNVSIQENECPLCGYEQEEADHLFFNCKMTRGLWWESMRWNQIVGPLSVSPASHFVQFCDGFGAGRNHTRWCGWWIALTSSIWKHRNLLIFQGNQFEPSKVMDDALFLAWSWWMESIEADSMVEENSLLVPRIPVGVSGTALAASLLRDGWSLAKMYAKYQEVVDALRHEQLGRKESEAVLQRVLYELEQKAEAILDERVEHDKMADAYSLMNQKLQNSLNENSNLEKTIQELKADLKRRERDYNLVLKETDDLQKQVTVLLKECRDIQLRCGSMGYDIVDDASNIASRTSRETEAEDVISEHLLTFKDINGLVEQNVQLRSLVRSISGHIENQEVEFKEKLEMELKKHTEESASKVAAVLQRAEEQGHMIEALHASVAMYKRLYEEEHNLHLSHTHSSEALAAVAAVGRNNIKTSIESSQEAAKKSLEKAAERVRCLEDDLAKSSTESLIAAEELSRKLSMELSVLKQEKEVISNAEKRASDEVHSLSARVQRLQASLSTIQSTEEVREEARAAERVKQEEYIKKLEVSSIVSL
ncbi:Nuclear-pore anchor isoform B [Glycine soja]|uniref:Nuclear-pore anchor isoform B n=1 Tax=Glycine soja TaxID=3848 RepID=A0A445GYN3_GLYSO|nr:Nuclear-pore anchor isoform B [Glycine soja]